MGIGPLQSQALLAECAPFNTRQESPVEFHCLAGVNVFVGHRGIHSALVLAHLARMEQCRMSSLMLVCHGVSPSPLFTSSHDELPQALLVECATCKSSLWILPWRSALGPSPSVYSVGQCGNRGRVVHVGVWIFCLKHFSLKVLQGFKPPLPLTECRTNLWQLESVVPVTMRRPFACRLPFRKSPVR